jgi:hypothetical protein
MLLSAPERTRAASFRRLSDRRDFVAAHALVRMCGAAALGDPPAALVVTQRCERCGESHGRPVLAGRVRGILLDVVVDAVDLAAEMPRSSTQKRIASNGELVEVFDAVEPSLLGATTTMPSSTKTAAPL